MRVTIASVLIALTMSPAFAQEAQLRAIPKNCVALKKGRVCYQSIDIHFKALNSSDYCLVSSEQSEPLQCWTDKKEIKLRYRFASDKDVEFTMLGINGEPVANARVSLVWVYKQSRKRNRWRLF